MDRGKTFKYPTYVQYGKFQTVLHISSLPPLQYKCLYPPSDLHHPQQTVFIQHGSMAQLQVAGLQGSISSIGQNSSLSSGNGRASPRDVREMMSVQSLIQGQRSSVLGHLSSCSVCSSCSVRSGPAQPSSLHLSSPSIPARRTKNVSSTNTTKKIIW